MSNVIILADHRRATRERRLAEHQAELLLAPYRAASAAMIATVTAAAAVAWCAAFFPLLWLAR